MAAAHGGVVCVRVGGVIVFKMEKSFPRTY